MIYKTVESLVLILDKLLQIFEKSIHAIQLKIEDLHQKQS